MESIAVTSFWVGDERQARIRAVMMILFRLIQKLTASIDRSTGSLGGYEVVSLRCYSPSLASIRYSTLRHQLCALGRWLKLEEAMSRLSDIASHRQVGRSPAWHSDDEHHVT